MDGVGTQWGSGGHPVGIRWQPVGIRGHALPENNAGRKCPNLVVSVTLPSHTMILIIAYFIMYNNVCLPHCKHVVNY